VASNGIGLESRRWSFILRQDIEGKSKTMNASSGFKVTDQGLKEIPILLGSLLKTWPKGFPEEGVIVGRTPGGRRFGNKGDQIHGRRG